MSACVRAKLLQSCSALCNPMGCSPPGSSVHGILPARILELVAMPSSKGSSQLRDQTHVSYISCIGRWVLYHEFHLGSLRAKMATAKLRYESKERHSSAQVKEQVTAEAEPQQLWTESTRMDLSPSLKSTGMEVVRA